MSEFDVWWSIERKAREKAKHGVFRAYLDGEERETKQSILLDAMNAEYKFIPVQNKNYESMYKFCIKDISQAVNVEKNK